MFFSKTFPRIATCLIYQTLHLNFRLAHEQSYKKCAKLLVLDLVLSNFVLGLFTEATTGGALSNKVFLKISQNSKENICAGVSFLIRFETLDLQLY